MKSILFILLILCGLTAQAQSIFMPPAAPPSIVLAWGASPTSVSEPINYRVIYGTNSGVYIWTNAALTNLAAIVTNLDRGVAYYFNVQAYDSNGLVSPVANEVAAQWNYPPLGATNFRIISVSP
jgi:hypothetical protein